MTHFSCCFKLKRLCYNNVVVLLGKNLKYEELTFGNRWDAAALYQHQGFRTAHPYLIPTHLALYACHTLQEECELRRCQLQAKAKAK